LVDLIVGYYFAEVLFAVECIVQGGRYPQGAEAGDDVLGKVRPFLKETPQEGTAKLRASKTIAITP